MEIPHLSANRSHSSHTLPSIRVHDPNHSNSDRCGHLPLRTASHLPERLSNPMSIPNSKEYVPPPLPPPRHIDDVDIAWQWGNNQSEGFGQSKNASVSHGSSLFRGQSPNWEGDERKRPSVLRRGSSGSTVKYPESEAKHSGMPPVDEGYASLSGTKLSNHRLHGEEPLRHAIQNSVDHAYDKSLLQKIEARSNPASENPNTPPRTFQPSLVGFASEPSPTSNVPFERSSPAHSSRTFSVPDSAVGSSASTAGTQSKRWSSVPDTGVFSPRNLPSAGYSSQGYMDFRSPRREGTGSVSSLVSDSDHPTAAQERRVRRAGSASVLGSHDDVSSGGAKRSYRESYDNGIFVEADPDFPIDENNAMRHLNLGDPTPPRLEGFSPDCRTGQKRRASSPPQERDDRFALGSVNGTSDLFHRRTSGHLSANRGSPVHRSIHGSVSSTTSSIPRNGSYASSAGLSAGASSMTSMSSYDRLSPGGVSPSSELDPGHDSPYIPSVSLDPSPRTSISRGNPHQRTISSETKSAASVARKMSSDGQGHAKQTVAAGGGGCSKLQGILICECCPKKPKKFENLEELRVHEMEKQYTCSYCHNRFKNKNEAERHQNSLHLRRHSWSCAALSGVEAAFHPSTSSRHGVHPSAQTQQQQPQHPHHHHHHHQSNNQHQHDQSDVCGYCGEEFPYPPNWDARVEHLTSVHKFGECNQAKKFFRADHFRQHLKHSHAGTSGKWTNQLENACMKDEPLPERTRVGGPGGGVAVLGSGGSSNSSSSGGSIPEGMVPVGGIVRTTAVGVSGGSGGSGGGGCGSGGAGVGGASSSVRGSVISEEHDET
ncbi:MAG: hypothetical protein M1837_006053 [Sclerophora amabilis]|nr:MAG: hypothetical protein M1837_006053 [Sclerophora amabilis]